MRGGLPSPTVESADEAYRFGALRLDEGLDPLPGAVREDLVDPPRAYLRDRGELEPHGPVSPTRAGFVPVTSQPVRAILGKFLRQW